jgi:3-oxoacyl-[acyl-carrier protein] reductase
MVRRRPREKKGSQSMTDRPNSPPSTVLVTGAAAGIGEGVARAFAAQGANVVLADLDGDRLEVLAGELRGQAKAVKAARLNVTDTAGVEELVASTCDEFGSVDVLIGAAGGHAGAKPSEEVTDDEWERSLSLNLGSAFKCARAVIPIMKHQRNGRIVLISSATARMPTTVASSVVHYAVAKAGIMGLVRQLAVELGPYSVTVNGVAPGTTYTPRVERIRTIESLGGIAATVPLGRVATVEDQVGPIMFLASEAAKYVTGAVLDVNGGRIMS